MCPGKVNDLRAFEASSIQDKVQQLPDLFFIVGDNAYICSEHLLVPFPGGHSVNSREDSFNYYLSQLRCRIENCFALFVGKWGILWRPLQVCLRHQPLLLTALACLHNFVIDCSPGPVGRGFQVQNADGSCAPSFTNAHRSNYNNDVTLDDQNHWSTEYQFQPSVGNGNLRDQLADMISANNLGRPEFNQRSHRNRGLQV
jgi:hypothetical protein